MKTTTTKKKFSRDKYYSVSDLKSLFKFTDTIISKMKVSVTRPNPIYASKSPMKFYLKTYVTRFMKTKTYLNWKLSHEQRSESIAKMKATVQLKNQTILQQGLDKLNLTAIARDLDSIVKTAIKEKQEFDRECYWKDLSYTDRDIESARLELKHRWVVNYIRHILSNYDDVYPLLRKKDHSVVKQKINTMIEELLPGIDAAILRVFPKTERTN